MTRPYSMDLRDRAVARVEAGESVRSVASALSISAATVVRWSQRYRASGSAAPGKIGGHKPRLLTGDLRAWLLDRTKTDFTLRGLVAELAERGVKVDYVQVWRFVHAEGLSFKKKRSPRRTVATESDQTTRAVEEIPNPA
jgi:putative transposase